MSMDYFEILIYTPLVGSVLLFIGSKMYGIELPKDEKVSEEISDPQVQGFIAALHWDIKKGGFAYSAHFNKPHMRILRLSILACVLPVFPLALYFTDEISFRAMCMALFWYAIISGNVWNSELGNDAVMAGIGFSQATRIIFLLGMMISVIGGLIGGLYVIDFLDPLDLLAELFSGLTP